MRAYFDTSALVPLAVDEPATSRCLRIWTESDAVVTTSLAYVEAHAALALAMRMGRLTAAGHRRAVHTFEERWCNITRIRPGDALVRSAARLCATQALRGYDAIHAATGLAAASDDFVAISGDRRLLRAWTALGLATIDTAS